MDENLSAQNSPYVLLDSQITVACLQCTFLYIVLIYRSFHLGFDTGRFPLLSYADQKISPQ